MSCQYFFYEDNLQNAFKLTTAESLSRWAFSQQSVTAALTCSHSRLWNFRRSKAQDPGSQSSPRIHMKWRWFTDLSADLKMHCSVNGPQRQHWTSHSGGVTWKKLAQLTKLLDIHWALRKSTLLQTSSTGTSTFDPMLAGSFSWCGKSHVRWICGKISDGLQIQRVEIPLDVPLPLYALA